MGIPVTTAGSRGPGAVAYSIGLAVLWATVTYGLKLHYSRATSEDLAWVLKPTAHLVELISGARFSQEPGVGHVSRELATAIVPGCAGVNFLIAAWSVLLGAHWLRRSPLMLAPAMLPLAYVATVAVNAARIVLDIALRSQHWPGISHATQHRAIGVVVYVVALAGLYRLRLGAGRARTWSMRLVPLLGYLCVALLIPLVNGAGGLAYWVHARDVVLVAVACAVGLEVARTLPGLAPPPAPQRDLAARVQPQPEGLEHRPLVIPTAEPKRSHLLQ